ncbi:TPA: hypothetical protein QDB45_001691 [Burkholderia vietnamiensis]|nr:hypothetical protein [Burkholderia vietnamiensis]
MQDYSNLDQSRNAIGVMPAPVPGWRARLAGVKAFYLAPDVPIRTRAKRFAWSAVGALVVVVLAQQVLPHRPDVVYAPPAAPVILPAPVAPVRPALPPDTAKMFTQEQLDQKRDAWVDQTQAMASDAEKRAPGSLGAYQARSFADFLAAHCGKPGGCLKK